MQCDEVRNKLSDYVDGLLSAEDDALVRSHIAGCPGCRTALSELEETVEHIKNLEEVEPPAWLTRKVMARVKEETAGRKGLWRRLFYPLHIKLPLEAAAAVVIALTALYIFNMNRGVLIVPGKRMPEVREQSVPGEDKALRQSSGAGENKIVRGPENAVEEEPARPLRSQSAESGNAAAVEEGVKATARQKVFPSPKSVLPGPPAQGPSAGAKRNAASSRSAEVYGGAINRSELKEKAATGGAPVSEKEAATRGSKKGYSMKETGDASSFDRISGAAFLTALEVDDPAVAVKEIRSALAKLDGRITAAETLRGGTALTVEIDSRKIGEFFEKLKTVGKIGRKNPPDDMHKGFVAIRIEILKRP